MNWQGVDLRWAYSELLLSLSRRTQCVYRAEDILHDGFVRYALRCASQPVEQPHAYLRRITHNILIDQYRQQGKWQSLSLDDDEQSEVQATHADDFAPSAEYLADIQQRLEALQRILNHLPPRCREVFWLTRVEGISQPQVAKHLGISLNTVERHLIRAMLDLRAARDALLG